MRSRVAIARAASAIALVATYLITWDLWQERGDPPNLPLFGPLAGVPFGVVLVVAALATIRFPRSGASVHAALVVLAVLGDQLRIQPEVASLALLLVCCSFGPRLAAVGRWHLAALWGWAGLHKLLSAGWTFGGAGYIAGAAGADGLRPLVAVALPLAEVGLGVLALRRSTWVAVRVGAPLLHLGIFGVLLLDGWNSSVWPWNLALAIVAPMLFLTSEPADTRVTTRHRATVAVVAVLLVEPAGFYVGIGHPYLQHHLYSSAEPTAARCRDGECVPFDTWDELNVPVPPLPHTFRAWFDLDCRPDETLVILGRHTRSRDRTRTEEDCASSEAQGRPQP